MLMITIPARRFFIEQTEEYLYMPPRTLKLEHSLLSISKWESKWHKSYLSSTEFTPEESMDYVRCMSLDTNVTPEVLKQLTKENYEEIRAYIENPMTATTFSDKDKSKKREIITSEVIYWMMIENGIPFECEKWHINRLFTLIKVCAVKHTTNKKTKAETAAMYRALSEARRKKTGSHG